MWLTDLNGIMETMLYTGAVGLTAAAVIYAVFALLTRKKHPAPMRTHILRYVFAAYCVCVLVLTLSPGYAGGGSANLVPFSRVLYAVRSGFGTAQYLVILNILMFLPLGVLLPLVFKRMDRLYKTALISLVATLVIELLQTLIGRAFDIDDILMNTLGGALGYALYALCAWVFRRKKQGWATRIASLAVLAAIPVFIAVMSISGAREFNYLFSYRIDLPHQMTITAGKELPATGTVYALETPDAENQLDGLKALFGISGANRNDGSSLVCGKEDARLVSYTEMNGWSLALRATDDTPVTKTDEELTADAQTWLEQYGLLAEGFAFDYADDIYTNTRIAEGEAWGFDNDPDTGEAILPDGVVITGRTVTLSLAADAPDTGYATFSFDGAGLYEVSYRIDRYAAYKEMPLLSPDEALRLLSRSGRCYCAADVLEPESAEFTEVALGYFPSEDGRYMLPAWELSGTFTGKENTAAGTLTVEALAQ